jgi:hypothetical protein
MSHAVAHELKCWLPNLEVLLILAALKLEMGHFILREFPVENCPSIEVARAVLPIRGIRLNNFRRPDRRDIGDQCSKTNTAEFRSGG